MREATEFDRKEGDFYFYCFASNLENLQSSPFSPNGIVAIFWPLFFRKRGEEKRSRGGTFFAVFPLSKSLKEVKVEGCEEKRQCLFPSSSDAIFSSFSVLSVSPES